MIIERTIIEQVNTAQLAREIADAHVIDTLPVVSVRQPDDQNDGLVRIDADWLDETTVDNTLSVHDPMDTSVQGQFEYAVTQVRDNLAAIDTQDNVELDEVRNYVIDLCNALVNSDYRMMIQVGEFAFPPYEAPPPEPEHEDSATEDFNNEDESPEENEPGGELVEEEESPIDPGDGPAAES